MHITTKEKGIINPDNYPRIDIYPDAGDYLLCAFTERDPDQNAPKQRITIAIYNEKVDADYALIHLYRALDMAKNTWHSKDVPLLSDIWNKVKQKLSNDQHVSELIKNASIDVTLPDQLTIKMPYSVPEDEINDKESDFITIQAKKVSTEVINLLKEDPVFPIRTFNLDLFSAAGDKGG